MGPLATTFALALSLAGGVGAQWEVRGCKHGHGYQPASEGLMAALRHHQPLTRTHGRRAWHFALCTQGRDDTVRLKGERRNWLEWRRSYPHLYRIRYNRFPVWVHGWLRSIAACESHGNPRAIGGGGAYRGKFQFSFSTWAAVGGFGDPAAAHPWEQDYRAALLLTRYGAQALAGVFVMSDVERVAEAIEAADRKANYPTLPGGYRVLAEAAIAAMGPQLTPELAARAVRMLRGSHTPECEDHALATRDQEPCVCGLDGLLVALSLIAERGGTE